MKRNRLKITMESRIHGDVYVRFGGERLETYRPKGRQGALRLACGTGIYHSEMNGSDTKPAEFLHGYFQSISFHESYDNNFHILLLFFSVWQS